MPVTFGGGAGISGPGLGRLGGKNCVSKRPVGTFSCISKMQFRPEKADKCEQISLIETKLVFLVWSVYTAWSKSVCQDVYLNKSSILYYKLDQSKKQLITNQKWAQK